MDDEIIDSSDDLEEYFDDLSDLDLVLKLFLKFVV